MKKYVLILLIFVVSLKANAQITTTICPNYEGFKEFPMLYKVNSEDIPLYKMPAFNLDSVLQYEYDLDIKGVGRPYRFGYTFDTDYGMEHGKWIEFEDKNIWSIRFRSDKAYTLNFRFADLKLSYGTEMYVYNSDGTIIDGPYTYKDNTTEEFRSIGSDLIDGEEVIIQIIKPKETKQSSFIKIARVVHGFRDHYSEILPNKDKRGDSFQTAELDCHNDVMCYPEYEDLSRGIGRIMIGNQYWCSGALLNNVRGNNRPYFLTAYHCADRNSDDALSPTEINHAEIWGFQFNYKKSICNGTNFDTVLYVKRYEHAYFRAAWGDTDFLLLELKEAVTDPEIRFLGWDVLAQNPSYHNPVVAIHHPQGDLMKVSTRTGWVYTNGDCFKSTKDLWYDKDHFWEVWFHNGAIEGGSSGSPLFRKYTDVGDEYRVIGQLGFSNGTTCPPDQRGRYGVLFRSRDVGGTPDTRLRDWLYPDGFFQYTINSATPNQSFTFENKTLTNYERIVSKNIILQNVTINSGATLLLQASESITLGPNVVLKTGGTLITEGKLLMNSGYKVEAGASFIVK